MAHRLRAFTGGKTSSFREEGKHSRMARKAKTPREKQLERELWDAKGVTLSRLSPLRLKKIQETGT